MDHNRHPSRSGASDEFRGVDVPLRDVITRFYAYPVPRRGDRSARLWWVCPFHKDSNPSLCVEPEDTRYHCYGCDAHGDAVDFVRGLNPGMGFREAVEAITGGSRVRQGGARRAPPRKPMPPDRPGSWQEFALDIVVKAEQALWSERGRKAFNYLVQRGLAEETIRSARLGYWPSDEWRRGVYADKAVCIPRGIVIPWFEGVQVEAVNFRRPVSSRPGTAKKDKEERKYHLLRGSHRGRIYPGPRLIVPGRPLILTEGEFEALLLNQDLAGIAAAITLGSASDRPNPKILSEMFGATPWFIGPDTDDAGQKTADSWIEQSRRSVRVLPPLGKDWTEAKIKGLVLKNWWSEFLSQPHRPPPDSSLSNPVQEAPFNSNNSGNCPDDPLPGPADLSLRWGPGLEDDSPSIDVPRDWRWTVATWPHDRWPAWRRRSGELEPPDATIEDIREAERQAFAEIAAERTRPDA